MTSRFFEEALRPDRPCWKLMGRSPEEGRESCEKAAARRRNQGSEGSGFAGPVAAGPLGGQRPEGAWGLDERPDSVVGDAFSVVEFEGQLAIQRADGADLVVGEGQR